MCCEDFTNKSKLKWRIGWKISELILCHVRSVLIKSKSTCSLSSKWGKSFNWWNEDKLEWCLRTMSDLTKRRKLIICMLCKSQIWLLRMFLFMLFLVLLQVWFQNKRSKERRLKQLTTMGRGPFFGSSRKMRGFPMNLSPGGMEDGPPGFPFYGDVKLEYGYGGPPFHPHDGPFFPGHHPGSGPGGQPMPFNQPGTSLSLEKCHSQVVFYLEGTSNYTAHCVFWNGSKLGWIILKNAYRVIK